MKKQSNENESKPWHLDGSQREEPWKWAGPRTQRAQG